MSPPPDPGSGKIDVTPEDVHGAAKDFCTAQSDLNNAWTKLWTTLDNNAGFAGNDSVAENFTGKYDRGVKAAWKAIHQGILTLGGISNGLTTTANNFLKADHHSTVNKGKGPPKLFDPQPVFTDVYTPLPSAAKGPGSSGLPGPLAKFWPNADTGECRAAAKAWHDAAASIAGINGRVNGTIIGITSYQDDDSAKDINEFWDHVYKKDDPKTVLGAMHKICQSLGDACDKYAKSVDDAHGKMKDALWGAGIAIGLTTVIGGLLTAISFGGSDAAAGAADAAEAEAILGPIVEETATTVATETGAALAEDLITTVETAAEEAPSIEAVEADVTEIEGALDDEMAETEGEATPKVETGDGRYTGDLVEDPNPKPDPDADALAERIGGKPRVRFENDPDEREFDAVSDEYVGQSKPANYKFNKAGRDQAKATFEAARESGRSVYYHFDGDPDPSVITKLNEYAQRYGVDVHIDTTPF